VVVDRLRTLSSRNCKGIPDSSNQYRMHVSYRYTIFFYPKDRVLVIDEIMTTEQAHKEYGRI